MSGHKRKRGGGHDGGHENDERWLLTYADMITLLMALFMVLFSISSVNISKYQTLQKSLKSAFSGGVLTGGRAIMNQGGSNNSNKPNAQTDVPQIMPINATRPVPGAISSATLSAALHSAMAAQGEQDEFKALRVRLQQYADQHGFGGQVQASIERRGLVVRVLTDKLLFGSGSATLKPAGVPLLTEVARLLNLDRSHPITVEGHTDNTPIATAQFPSNWELSTARATNVLEYLVTAGVDQTRLGAAGYSDQHPITSNDSDQGRSQNRRVEIVFQRLNPLSN